MRAAICVFVCGCNAVPLASSAVSATPPKPRGAQVPVDVDVATAAPVIFAVPDETMEFGVSLRGIHVGIVQTAVGKPGWIDGRRAIIVKSRGRTDGFAALIGDLTWELTTTIDLDKAMPIDDREEAWVEFAGEKHHENETHTWSTSDEHRHDVHSSVCALRGWHAERGASTEVRVDVGGGHFPIAISDAGSYTVHGRRAVRFDGTANEQFHFSLWITDDAARVPLAFTTESKLGTIAVDLV